MSQPQPFSASAPPTPMMAGVGLSFDGILEAAKKAVKFIEDQGDEAIAALEAGWRAIVAVSERDLMGLLAALNDVNRNAASVVQAFRDTFGI